MDSELENLFNEYKAVNNEEKEGDLEKIANKIRERQAILMEQEGHTGV